MIVGSVRFSYFVAKPTLKKHRIVSKISKHLEEQQTEQRNVKADLNVWFGDGSCIASNKIESPTTEPDLRFEPVHPFRQLFLNPGVKVVDVRGRLIIFPGVRVSGTGVVSIAATDVGRIPI